MRPGPVTAAVRVAAWAAAAAGIVAAAVAAAIALLPVTIVALVSVTAAWWQGWPPARLYRAAAWCLPMLAVWLAATAATRRSLAPAADAPRLAWLEISAHGDYLAAATLIAPVAVPLGLLAGGFIWSRRLAIIATGTGGRSPAAVAAFDRQQWRHQVRVARARAAMPGGLPLLTRDGGFVAGATIRAVGHPAGRLTVLPASRLRSHQILIGETGTGKTALMLRLMAAFVAASPAARPLVVAIDCKGGADARRQADRARQVLLSAGAGNVAVWPHAAALSLWRLPAGELVTTLVDLIEHGTGGAAYYADVLEAAVARAVQSPGGPPASAADFLARLDVPDVSLRFATLFRRLGPGLDAPPGCSFADADAWYCILDGTAQPAVAEAQARALVDLLASHVTARDTPPRPVLLAVDEFSAVSRRLPLWQLFERARSLGLAVWVSAQSWHGLAPTQDERYRLATTAEGGIWLLRTPLPDPVVELAGQRPAVDTARNLAGPLRWGRGGSSRLRRELTTDPDLIRILDTGQVAYLYRGGVTFAQVSPLQTAGEPEPLPQAPEVAQPEVAQPEVAVRPVLADITAFLDEAFGGPP